MDGWKEIEREKVEEKERGQEREIRRREENKI
jgi:hypothetical protein